MTLRVLPLGVVVGLIIVAAVAAAAARSRYAIAGLRYGQLVPEVSSRTMIRLPSMRTTSFQGTMVS
jgi:uncharacterized membrane protein YjgN (DUF898 family)